MPGIDANTLLCCHCDGADGGTTFIDSALTPHTLTAGGNTVTSAAQAYFGNASLSNGILLATAGVTSSTPADFQPASAFTIDLWFNAGGTGAASNQYLLSLAQGIAAANIAFGLYRLASSGLVGAFIASGSTTYEVDSLAAYTDAAWHHLAFVISAGAATLFVDGVSQSTMAVPVPNVLTSPTFAIGNLMPGTDPSLAWPGLIDEVRISNVARWTSNFAVPTGAYDNQQLFNMLPQLSTLLAS